MNSRKIVLVVGFFGVAWMALLACGCGHLPGNSPDATAGPIVVLPLKMPTGLPTHLGLGLKNSPSQISWMRDSGIPWDYRYQYLTGGVNTGEGWTTWGYPTGTFVESYLQDSNAAGYLPLFTYYQIVPSEPDAGDETPAKLQNASTMRAYFTDWALLMQKAGAYGKPVIVQVEPDLWGHLQTVNADAAAIPVAVASSGFPEAASYADTASGFAQALIALRDKYAPDVILGYHISQWATGKDLILNKQDPNKTADALLRFYRSLGADFDLLFFGPSDRDAAWLQVQRGTSKYWWDADTFDRFRQFTARLVQGTGRPAVLWQVPLGNTLYRSLDNSWGHYQDNRAQYWLDDRAHLDEYAQAGVIGVLFGGGANGCTMYDDSMADGVTNPEPINGNNLTASYADDDGGYLRLKASEYYAAGPILLSPSSPYLTP